MLRGPQDTLFGRDSPAGVAKFDSANPEKICGYANVSSGKYGVSNVEGAINVPLNQDCAMRFSGRAQHREHWLNTTYKSRPTRWLEGYTDSSGRVQLMYQPNTDASAFFNVHGRDLSGISRPFRANIIEKGCNGLVANFNA